MEWDTSGFPVVDRASPHAGLTGFELVPLEANPGRNGHSVEDAEIREEGDEMDMSGYNALLVQQSGCGDVFTQQLRICRRRFTNIGGNDTFPDDVGALNDPRDTGATHVVQTRLPSGVGCTSVPIKPHSSRSSAQKRLCGTSLGPCVLPDDRVAGVYPRPSSSFFPVQDNSSLKR